MCSKIKKTYLNAEVLMKYVPNGYMLLRIKILNSQLLFRFFPTFLKFELRYFRLTL